MLHSSTKILSRSKVIIALLAAFLLTAGNLTSRAEGTPKVEVDSSTPATPLKVNPVAEKRPEKYKKNEHPNKKEKPPQDAQSVMRKALPPELAQLFPIGRIFKGVVIPSYGEDTAIESVMNSAIVTRISEDFIDFTDLVIFFYNAGGDPETSIQMDQAQYNLESGLLTSKTPANIEQERFTMRGDKMTFEAESRLAGLIGNVRMLIYDDQMESSKAPTEGDEAVEITAQESSMDNAKRQITFLGDVLVLNKEDHITMKCDKLEVFLAPEGTRIKDASGKQSKISRIIASGKMVEIRTIDEDGNPRIALARMANYDAITKDAILSGGPPSIQDGKGNFVSTQSKDSKIILRNNGQYQITGSEPHIITIPVEDGKGIGDLGVGIESEPADK